MNLPLIVPAILSVCANCELTSLKQAVLRAKPHDHIIVKAGRYKESKIEVTIPLVIEAENDVVLDGDNQGTIINVRGTSDVTIKGFTFKDTGHSYTEEYAGIRVINGQKCLLEGNQFLNTTYGIYLERSQGCQVKGNRFQGNAQDEVAAGNAIHVWTGADHIIEDNELSGHRDGIYLEFAKGIQIYRNQVHHHIRYGLHFMQSNETTYDENVFLANGAGVAVMYSKKITMRNNTFKENQGASAYGLLLKEIQDSRLERNLFQDNTVGIFMEGSNRTHFFENRLIGNGFALRIMGDCEGNRFERNDFVSNMFEVSTNADHSWNTFSGNYWSAYDGFDLEADGKGDIPHRPVSVAATLLDQVDSSATLIGSFLFKFLDAFEKVFPELIPEPLKDETPLMKPWAKVDQERHG